MTRTIATIATLLCMTAMACTRQSAPPDPSLRPADIVDVATLVPDLVVDLRYATSYNFTGRPLVGYLAPRCLLKRPAALALAKVQAELKARSLSLKVYDCYRPLRAVHDLVRWANDPADQAMKAEFYPRLEKSRFLQEGYLSPDSLHATGWQVDLTLVPLPVPPQPVPSPGRWGSCIERAAKRFPDNSLDMGTGFDCFDERVRTPHPDLSPAALANRLRLKAVMEKHGFENNPDEWWEYSFTSLPSAAIRFDFVVN